MVLSRLRPRDPVTIEREHVARQLNAEIRPIDKELFDNRQRTCEVVEACATTADRASSGSVTSWSPRSSITPAPSDGSPLPPPSYQLHGLLPRSSIQRRYRQTPRCRVRATGNSTPHCTWWPRVQRMHPGVGLDYYRRMIDEGKIAWEAMRCLKRELTKVIYRWLRDDANRARTASSSRPPFPIEAFMWSRS